jgi:hypothetical protein
MASSTEKTADGKPQPDPKPARKHPVRKWIVRIGVSLALVVLLAAIGIQIIMWTGLPRSIVISEVENRLGLRLGVKTLSTGWLGHTTLDGVQIALPLSADQAFFDVPELKVHHTSLLGIVFGWSVDIYAIELTKPVLYVRQNAAGRWNLQEVTELLGRTAGKKNAEQTANQSTPSLPKLTITGMTIVVVNNKNQQAQIEPINVDGSPGEPAPLVWKYDIEIPSGRPNVPSRLSFLGKLVPGRNWEHQATIQVGDILPFIQKWVPKFDTPIALHANWTGRIENGGVRGYLQIIDSTFGSYHAKGAANASENDDVFAVSPDNLQLSMSSPSNTSSSAKPTTAPAQMTVTIPRGTIDYNGKVARATQVQLTLLGGPAVFNGWFEPATNQGALEAYWQNLQVPKADIQQSGKLNLTYTRPIASPIRIELSAGARGTAEGGPFDASVHMTVTGNQFSSLNWELSTPQLAWYHAPHPIVLEGLSAGGTYTQDAQHQVVQMTRVSLPADNRLGGTASYDLTTKKGDFKLHGEDWPIHWIAGTKLAFDIAASFEGVPKSTGSKELVPFMKLDRFELDSADSKLVLAGYYDERRPKPVNLKLSYENEPGPAAESGRPGFVRGYLAGAAVLQGTRDPTNIAIEGSLEGRQAEVLGHYIGDLSTKIVGAIDDEKASVHADGIPFLGGLWNLAATYTEVENGKAVDQTDVHLSVVELPLQKVSQFVNGPPVDGIFAGDWHLYFPGIKPSANRLRLSGGGKIDNLVASSFIADSAEFKTSLDNGTFKIDPVLVKRKNYGTIEASAQTTLDQWRQINAAVRFTAFPIDMPEQGIGVQLWTGTGQNEGPAPMDTIAVYLPDPKAKDPDARNIRVDSDIHLRSVVSIESTADASGHRTQQPEGALQIAAEMRGRVVTLRKVSGLLLGGSIDGNATVDLDQIFTRSTAHLTLSHVQAAPLVRLYPELDGFGGAYTLQASLAPASDPRPLEPLALGLNLIPADGHWKAVNIGTASINAYVGPHRIITSSQLPYMTGELPPSVLHIGGGAIDVWFSSVGHIDIVPDSAGKPRETGITISNQLNLGLRNLQIDQFVSSFDPSHRPGFGLLSGSIFILSAPETRAISTRPTPPQPATMPTATATATTVPATILATTRSATRPAPPDEHHDALMHVLVSTTLDGNLRIGESDLADFGPIAGLYNLMHLGANMHRRTGHGTIALHMEEGQLHISNFYYFNRGIEAYGVADVFDVWKLQNAPVRGALAGSLQPLKNIKLPLLAELSAVLVGLQKQFLTTEIFAGTVVNPVKDYLVPAGLAQVGGELRSILLGELGANTRQ